MKFAGAVANELLDIAKDRGQEMTNLKLVKLTYIAHGLCLAMLDEPLFDDENVEAWKYGPVVPSVYHEFKRFGRSQIPCDIRSINIKSEFETEVSVLENESHKKVVEITYNLYEDVTGERLIDLTHKKGTPWAHTFEPGKNKIIRNSLIKEYYDIYLKNLDKMMREKI